MNSDLTKKAYPFKLDEGRPCAEKVERRCSRKDKEEVFFLGGGDVFFCRGDAPSSNVKVSTAEVKGHFIRVAN